jgi:hypothetical protein
MRLVYTKIDNTFIIGISYSNYYNQFTKKMNTSLFFEFGKRSFAIIFRGEK